MHILAVIQADLQLICSLRQVLERDGYRTLSVSRSSQEAILYLRGVGIYQDRNQYPLPGIIVLDCQNQDSADLDVLSWLREHPTLFKLPIILLCSERHSRFHVACALDPASFIVDRANSEDLLDAVRAIEATRFFIPSLAHEFASRPGLIR